MNHLQETTFVTSNYEEGAVSPPPSATPGQFRSLNSLPAKDALNDMFQFGIDQRNHSQRAEGSLKRRITHHIHVPTSTRQVSSPLPNTSASGSEVNVRLDRSTPTPILHRSFHPRLIQMKSAALTIPTSESIDEQTYQNFPTQTHEKRKIAAERRRKKQQAQTLAEKYSDKETWFQLRRSLAELKRLATTDEVLVDPTTSPFNCDGHSFTTLKQIIAEQQEDKKAAALQSESGISASTFTSTVSSRDSSRTNQSTYGVFSRSRASKRPTETYPRLVFEPFIIANKPIHSSVDNDGGSAPLKSRKKPPVTMPFHPRPHSTTAVISEKKRSQLVISDLSNYDNVSRSSTPRSSPPPPPAPLLISAEQENPTRKTLTPSPIRVRPPSSIQFIPITKPKTQAPPRCRSATEMKPSYLTIKNYPRFILITDEDHRIESWYHQYPFVLGDDLFKSFEGKQPQHKSTICGYFIDDLNTSRANVPAKTFLQGKPFHIGNDWKKYDLIFISNSIYEKCIVYLEPIVGLIKSSGKIIKIYQINHEEDLRKQVKGTCKQLQQQNA